MVYGNLLLLHQELLLSNQECKSYINESECLAVVFGIDKFQRFLEHLEFLFEVDNRALLLLLARSSQLGKLGRWIVKISAFKFRVQHVKGTENIVADTLSNMFHSDDKKNSAVPCNFLLLSFHLAFPRHLSFQSDDPKLGPILETIEAGREHPLIS